MDIIIENENLRAAVSTHGAELVSVVNKATGEEMLWTADPAVWDRHAPLLFPYCGKLKDGRFSHRGTVYEGGQHGFARDMEHTVEAKAPASVTLALEANALTMARFPFAFKLATRYTLRGDVVVCEVRVYNDGDEEMPFGLGFHPGFICPFDAQHKTEDYVLRFSEPETPEVIETGEGDGLVTGRRSVYFRGESEIALTDHLFDRDSICFSGLRSGCLSIVEKDTGRAVHVDIAGFPYVLNKKKKGPMRFVCIEPWLSLPDARDASGEWADKPAAAVLAPGETFKTALRMRFAR